MADKEYTDIAISDIGTQFFYFNTTNQKFEYGVPVTAGAEFGGDVESFDAPETDLDYVPKIAGRTSLNDISYTSNYTKEKYARIASIIGSEKGTYMEVFNDGSAMIFQGTSGRPSITAGDIRQINFTIVPSFMQWIEDITKVSEDEEKVLNALSLTGIVAGNTGSKYINIDADSVPTARTQYYEGHSAE